MKILQLHLIMKTINGSERTVIELTNRLIENGINTEIASLNIAKECKEKINPKANLKELGFTFGEDSHFATLFQYLFFPLIIFKLLKIYPDIIISHNSDPLLAAILLKQIYKIFSGKSPKIIFYCYEPPRFAYNLMEETQNNFSFGKKIVFRALVPFFRCYDKFLAKKADLIITLSKFNQKYVKKIYGRDNIPVTYPGVLAAKNYKRKNIRRAFNLKKKFILLTVGKLHPRKNLMFQVEAVDKLKDIFPNIYLLIVGGGPQKLELKKAITKKNLESYITLVGFVPDIELPSYYKQSDLFVFTAHEEPFGLVPIEAMAYGKAVIVPDEGGPKETCVEGITGFFYKQNDLNNFCHKISFLIKNPSVRKRYEQNALIQAKRFTWEKYFNSFSKQIEALYLR